MEIHLTYVFMATIFLCLKIQCSTSEAAHSSCLGPSLSLRHASQRATILGDYHHKNSDSEILVRFNSQ